MSACLECGEATSWDDELGSSICTACGTLVDPTQSVLTQGDQHDSARQFDPLWLPTTTLKSYRRGSNWDLAGQGKEARDRKNTFAIQAFIKSLLATLAVPGLAPRAITLFTQAMSAPNFRWGRKAKLVAAASIALALRDSNRPDSLKDIAFLIDESPVLLTRTFTSVISHLNLTLTPADPTLYISSIHSHLSSLLSSPDLPRPLLDLRNRISLQTATRTANSLISLISRLTLPISHLPTPPTACAIYILSLEAELRTSFTHLADLAQCLASRFSIGHRVVLTRYKLIQDLIADEWIQEVPWLDKYTGKKGGRAKVAKRVVVARGLKDVVQFREEIWLKKLHTAEKPAVDLCIDSDDSDSDTESPPPPPKKRRKTTHYKALDHASLFLLDPLFAPSLPHIASPSNDTPVQTGSERLPPTAPSLPLATYLLTSSLPTAPPTRLQLLAVARGGVGPEEVDDDELFAPGEWEGMLRGEEERAVLAERMGMLDAQEGSGDKEDDTDQGEKRKKQTGGGSEGKKNGKGPTRVGSKRVDMDALARLLDGTTGDDCTPGADTEPDGEEEDLDGDVVSPVAGVLTKLPELQEKNRSPLIHEHTEEVVVEEWRPLSPDGGGSGILYTMEGRYDEEYE